MPYDRTVGAYIERKQAIATDLTTREMQELSYQIRERAFWSATVNNAKVVNTMQRACADFAKGNLSMSDARLAIQKVCRNFLFSEHFFDTVYFVGHKIFVKKKLFLNEKETRLV